MPDARPALSRFANVDILRGLAIVWMTVFHACFDLQHFGFIQTDFYNNPFWTLQRAAIVSLFVFCAGLGQAIAVAQAQDWRRFWRRWRQIAGAALLVSAGSYLVFPHSFIYFGILHGMAAMLIVARCAAGLGRGLWLLGALAIVASWLAPSLHTQWPFLEPLNAPAWNWLGLISHKPVTEDYAPLLPWLGPMFWGMACGRWLMHANRVHLLQKCPAFEAGMLNSGTRFLAWLGRHSLPYYLLHQPLLFGSVALLSIARHTH